MYKRQGCVWIAVPNFNAGNGSGFYGAGGESAFFYRGTMYDSGATSVSGFTVAQAVTYNKWRLNHPQERCG